MEQKCSDLLCGGVLPTLLVPTIVLCNQVFQASVEDDHATDSPALSDVVARLPSRINQQEACIEQGGM
jgi:hypothetical protein